VDGRRLEALMSRVKCATPAAHGLALTSVTHTPCGMKARLYTITLLYEVPLDLSTDSAHDVAALLRRYA
jgi:hypothetical protein